MFNRTQQLDTHDKSLINRQINYQTIDISYMSLKTKSWKIQINEYVNDFIKVTKVSKYHYSKKYPHRYFYLVQVHCTAWSINQRQCH